MRAHLRAGTDAATFVLFDPAALPPDIEAQIEARGADPVEEQVRAGALVTYSKAGDGFVTMRLLVDEPPDAPGGRGAGAVRGARLRVPGGRVCFAGVEDLHSTAEGAPAGASAAESARVPPGEYRVDAYEPAWDAGAVEAAPGRAALRARAAIGCTALFVAGASIFLALCAFAGAAFKDDFRPVREALPYALGFHAVFWTAFLVLRWLPAIRRAAHVERALAESFPDVVVVLTRLG